jgi:aminopeptidase N
MVRVLFIYVVYFTTTFVGTVDLLEHAHHTLDVTAKVMPIYERMFDIEFPLPKLDTLLSIRAGGAMENWVTLFETLYTTTY